MANALTAVFGADATPFNSELNRMEASIARVASNGGISSKLFGGHGGGGPGGGSSGIIRELFVLMREASRGNWTRMAGSLTLLAQYTGTLGMVIKSSAQESIAHATALNEEAAAAARAALAEQIRQGVSEKQITLGAAKIAMSKAWQEQCLLEMTLNDANAVSVMSEGELEVAINNARIASSNAYSVQKTAEAAVVAEAAEIEAASATVSLGPIGWLIAGLIALGAVAYGLIRHFENLREAQKNLADSYDLTTRSFSEQAKTVEEANRQHQEGIDWVNKHAAAQENLKNSLERTIDAFKDQASAEIELARARGASKQQLAQMELQQEKRELDLLKIAKDAAEEQHHKDFLEEQGAQGRLDSFNSGTGYFSKSTLDAAKKKMDENAAIVDAAVEAQKSGKLSKANAFLAGGANALLPTSLGNVVTGLLTKAATDSDVLDFKVGNKSYHQSVSQSRDAFSSASSDVSILSTLETSIKDLLKGKQELSGKDLAAYSSLKEQYDKAAAKYGVDQRYKMQIANAEGQRGGGFSLNSQQRLGAYAATPPDWSVLLTNVKGIHENTKGLKPGTFNPVGSKPPQFGGRSTHK
jgi:hypothetical protein